MRTSRNQAGVLAYPPGPPPPKPEETPRPPFRLRIARVVKAHVLWVSDRDLGIFAGQLATMHDAGLPYDQGVELIATAIRGFNPRFADGLAALADVLRSGRTLFDAMSEMREIFPSWFLARINQGPPQEALRELAMPRHQ